jgi:hypothetical protein
MTETDDRLIKEFMLTGSGEVADNGFTRRVMARLPQRSNTPYVVAAVVAVAVLLVLFVTTGAAQGMVLMMRDFVVDSLRNGTLFAVLKSCCIVLIGLLVVAFQKLSSLS